MPRKATTALTALLVFGSASAVFADMANRGDSRGFFAEHSVSMVSSDRIAAMNDAAMPFSVAEKESSATSRLALLQKAFFCRGITGTTTVWIKLTGDFIDLQGHEQNPRAQRYMMGIDE